MIDSASAAVAARCYEDVALGSTFTDAAAFRENLENSFAAIPDVRFEVQCALHTAGDEALEALMVSLTRKAFEVRFARS